MIVAIDTATEWAGVALYDRQHRIVLAESNWRSNRRHTVELAPQVEAVLARAGVTWDSVALLAVTIGPGSYTGVRVGLSLAKGIAIARRIPIVPVPTPDVIAHAWRREANPLCVILQAGRKRVLWKCYQGGPEHPLGETLLGYPADLLAQISGRATLLCGEIDAVLREALLNGGIPSLQIGSPADCVRRSAHLAERAAEIAAAAPLPLPDAIVPLYIQP